MHLFGHIHEQRGHWQRDDQGHYQGGTSEVGRGKKITTLFVELPLTEEIRHHLGRKEPVVKNEINYR